MELILRFPAFYEPAIMIVMNLARRSFPPGRFSAVRIAGCSFFRKRIGSSPVIIYVVKWVQGEARKVSELEKTIDLLEEMDDEQLQAIQTVAKILVFRKPKANNCYSVDSQQSGDVRIQSPKRRLGIADGRYTIPDNIDVCNDEIAKMFGVAE